MSQINTSGGASIGKDVNTGGGNFVGRDEYNINVIVRLVEFAQLEGLFPKVEDQEDFGKLADSIEQSVKARLDNDLADATAFAGEVLSGVLEEATPIGTAKHVPIRDILQRMPTHVYKKLQELNYWQTYYEVQDGSNYRKQILWLDATSKLLRERSHLAVKRIGIGSTEYGTDLAFVSTGKKISGDVPVNELSVKDLRLLLIGVVMDLINLASDNAVNAQLVREITDLVIAKKKA